MDKARTDAGLSDLAARLAAIRDPAEADAEIARFLDGLETEAARAALARLTLALLALPDEAPCGCPEVRAVSAGWASLAYVKKGMRRP